MSGNDQTKKIKHIQNGYAASSDDLYRNKPFHGTIFRNLNGQKVYLQYVPESKRLTLDEWLSHKNITQGSFSLETHNAAGEEISIHFVIDKNSESKLSANPFLNGHALQPPAAPAQNGISKALKEEYEAEILRLSNNLKEADRENRKIKEAAEEKRKELSDELYGVKRELSQDKTETLINHKDEITDLKERHREAIDKMKNELTELKHEMRFKEMEYLRGSDRNGWDRVLDLVEEKGPEFISGIFQQLQANQPQQLTPEQLQAAQQMQAAFQQDNAEKSENSGNANQAPESANESPASNIQHPTSSEMAQVKENLQQELIKAALAVLSDKNADLDKYAVQIRQQMALLQQQGITLDAKAWVQMAKVLSERAIDEEITPERVAKVIEPALDGVKQFAFALKMMSPEKATQQLFSKFNIQAGEPVQKLVAKVIGVLQETI